MRTQLSRATALWSLIGLVLLTINLRAAITGIAPVLGELRDAFGLSGAEVGVLTTLPVLCLGVFASVAPAVARRFGTEVAIAGSLVMITLGILLRVVQSPVSLFVGTVLAGAGIALGNVLMPAVIKRASPARVGSLTGLAMMLMAASGAVAAGLAVPLDEAGGWRLALAIWAVPSALALLVWGPLATRNRHPRPTRTASNTAIPTPASSGTTQNTSAANDTALDTDAANGTALGTVAVNGVAMGTDVVNGVALGTVAINGTALGTDVANGVALGTDVANGVALGTVAVNGVVLDAPATSTALDAPAANGGALDAPATGTGLDAAAANGAALSGPAAYKTRSGVLAAPASASNVPAAFAAAPDNPVGPAAVPSVPGASGAASSASAASKGAVPKAQAAAAGQAGDGSLLRSRVAWYVALFMGLASLMFYVLMSWLPEIMRDAGFAPAAAGMMVSAMMIAGIPLGFLVPVFAARLRDQRPLVAAVAVTMVVGLTGLMLAPSAGWAWVLVLGLGTGSAFPLAYTLLTLRSPSPAIAAGLSGMAQTGGYLLAGFGPLAVGVLHGATGGWNVPLVLLLVLVVPEVLFGLLAARPGFVRPVRPPSVPVRPARAEEARAPEPARAR